MVDKVVVVYNIAVSPSYTVYCIWSNRTQCHHQLAISTIFLLASKLCCLGTTTIIGGVEDTRLEAKAKDTKKTEDRPRTAFPRTDTLEAKDRNARGQGQGHKRKCSPKSQKFFRRYQKKKKKKVFTKIFLAVSTKKRFPKNFSSASQNFSNSKNTAVLEPRTG